MRPRIGLSVMPLETPREAIVGLATEGDRLGYDGFFLPETWAYDLTVLPADAAARTTWITLGTGILGIWNRSAATIAMAAAALHAMSGERFVLGLGASTPQLAEALHDTSFEPPVPRIRRTVTQIRAPLRGERIPLAVTTNARALKLNVPPTFARSLVCEISARPLHLGAEVAGARQFNESGEVVPRLVAVAGLRRRLSRAVQAAIAVKGRGCCQRHTLRRPPRRPSRLGDGDRCRWQGRHLVDPREDGCCGGLGRHRRFWPSGVLLAELLSEGGDVDRSLTTLDAIPPEHRDTILAPEIRRVRGDLLLRRNERDDGERQLREAIDLARLRSQRMLELRATMSLTRLWQQTGRRRQAGQQLRAIYGWFTEGFDTTDLRAAKALLDELSDPSDL